MQISIPNINSSQLFAMGRHALSFIMGGVAFASVAHIITADDANAISGAVNQIATGLTSVLAGSATLVTMLTAAYSAYKASDNARLSAVAAMPSVTSVVVSTAEQANSIPSPKVVSQSPPTQGAPT